MLIITRSNAYYFGSLARVISQNARRYTVKAVEGYEKYDYTNNLKGRNGSQYVDKADVLYADVTIEEYQAYVDAHKQRAASRRLVLAEIEEAFRYRLEQIFGGRQ